MIYLRGCLLTVILILVGCVTTLEDISTWKNVGGEGVPKLIDALENENSDIRLAATNALAETGDITAVEPLIRGALTVTDTNIQKASENALISIATGDPTFLDVLIQKLNSGDETIQRTVERILESVSTPRAQTALNEFWDYEHALSLHTNSAYQDFLQRYPHSPFEQRILAKLDWLQKEAEGFIHYRGRWHTQDELYQRIISAERRSILPDEETVQAIITALLEESNKTRSLSNLFIDLIISGKVAFAYQGMEGDLKEFIESVEGKPLPEVMLSRGMVPIYGKWVTAEERSNFRKKVEDETESVSKEGIYNQWWAISVTNATLDNGPLSGRFGMQTRTVSVEDKLKNTFLILEFKLVSYNEEKSLEYRCDEFVIFDSEEGIIKPVGSFSTLGLGGFSAGRPHVRWGPGTYSANVKLAYVVPRDTQMVRFQAFGTLETKILATTKKSENNVKQD